MLRRFAGNDEDLQPGERCLYWRETGNCFHTIQWKGPAVVVAFQTAQCFFEQADNMSADLRAKMGWSIDHNV